MARFEKHHSWKIMKKCLNLCGYTPACIIQSATSETYKKPIHQSIRLNKTHSCSGGRRGYGYTGWQLGWPQMSHLNITKQVLQMTKKRILRFCWYSPEKIVATCWTKLHDEPPIWALSNLGSSNLQDENGQAVWSFIYNIV